MAAMRIVRTLALLAAAVSGYAALRRRRTVRLRLESGVKPEPLQRWEGEGGSVNTGPRAAPRRAARKVSLAGAEEELHAVSSAR